jgi:hypothetical protein
MHCNHPNANPSGRGKYCYPVAYDTCDCGGYEKLQTKTKTKKEKLKRILFGEDVFPCNFVWILGFLLFIGFIYILCQ